MSSSVSVQIVLGLLVFSIAFIPLEQCFPRRRQKIFRLGWMADVLYFAAGCWVGKYSNIASLGAALIIRDSLDLKPQGFISSQPGWIQLLEIVVTADFVAYWTHRLLHHHPFLWRLHAIHHSSETLDWLANARIHPLDNLFADYLQFIPIFWLGFSDGPLLAYTTLFLGFQPFFNHSNITVDCGPLRWIIATPQFHHWHHCNDPALYNRNFSQHLVIFDLLFGTLYLPADGSVPERYGVAQEMPAGFWRQLIHPLLQARSMSAERRLSPLPRRHELDAGQCEEIGRSGSSVYVSDREIDAKHARGQISLLPRPAGSPNRPT